MYEIDNHINLQEYNGLQILKLKKADTFEILSVSLEKGAIFPEHTSPTDALLIVLGGNIVFHINDKPFHLAKHQHFSFPKETEHWVQANENSKFLIIR